MAKFPIYEAQGTLPGSAGGALHHYSTDTGGQRLGRAMKETANTLGEIGDKIYQEQAQEQYVGAMTDAKRQINEKMLSFETDNTDETTYQREMDDLYRDLGNAEISNGWARRQYRQSLMNLRVAADEEVGKRVAKRVEDKWNATYAQASADGIMSGNIAVPLMMLASRKGVSEEEKQVERMKLEHSTALTQTRKALSANPDAVLAWKSADEMLAVQPKLHVEDYQNLRNEAIAQKAFLTREKDELSDALINDTLGKAWSMSLDEFRLQLQQMANRPGFDEQQKSKLLNVFIDAQQLRQSTGKSPFVVTQNELSLANMYLAIDQDQIGSIADINRVYMEGDKANWSTEDALRVKAYWRAQNKPVEEEKYSPRHPMAANYFDMWAARFKDRMKTVNGVQVFATTKDAADYNVGWSMLDTGFKKPGVFGDWAKMKEAADAVLAPAKEQDAKGFLSRLWTWANPPAGSPQWDLSSSFGSYSFGGPAKPAQTQVAATPAPPQLPYINPDSTKIKVVESDEEARRQPVGTVVQIKGTTTLYRVKANP